MTTYGYFLSSEEHGPEALVQQAVLAEEAGFEALWISDHFHPWNDQQGESPFVWSVIGAIANANSLPITTAVTCPTIRIHPAIIAQAAATSALLTGGRFQLGVGTGENLNEHILGDRWPPVDVRLDMLEQYREDGGTGPTQARCASTGTPATTRSSSPRSARRQRGSSGSPARSCSRRRARRAEDRSLGVRNVPPKGPEWPWGV